MKSPMKYEIDKRLEQLEITPQLKEKILKKANENTVKKTNFRLIFLAGCFIFILSVGALAGNSLFGFISHLLGEDSYETQVLQAIPSKQNKKANIYDGIKMDIAAAMTDGYATIAYIIIEDLTKDRLSGDFLANQFTFSKEGGDLIEGYTYTVADYNAREKRMILKMEMDGENLGGKEVGFQVGSFFSNEKFYQDILITSHISKFLQEMGNLSKKDMLYDESGNIFLPPDRISYKLKTIDTIQISNIAVIDNKLILQFRCQGGAAMENLINCLIVRPEKKAFGNARSYNYIYDENGMPKTVFKEDLGHRGIYYHQIIFDLKEADLTEDNLDDAGLYANVCIQQSFLRGNWDLDFKIEQVDTVKKECSIKIGKNGKITSISISPIGLTLKGYASEEEYNTEEIEPRVAIGQKEITFLNASSSWDLNKYENGIENVEFRYHFDQALDITQLKYVIINDTKVEITVE